MKENFKILVLALVSLVVISCQDDDVEFGPVVVPTNFAIDVNVASDQSGNVQVTATAENATAIHVFFEEDQDPVVIASGEQASYRYTLSGQYTKVINVIAYGTGGASISDAVVIELDVRLIIDPDVLQRIAGAGSKTWVWDSSNAGHFGVGEAALDFPNFFVAAPNQLNPCLYDDELTFSYDADDNYSFTLNPADATFINWAEIRRFFPDAEIIQFQDECRDISDQIDLETDFVILEDQETGALQLTVTNSTMSYWSGASTYTITELTDEKMVIRGIQAPFDPPGADLAWYHTFVPADGTPPPPNCDGSTGDTGTGNNDVLVWAEEFDFDGAPCEENWSYNIGTGEGGWGNNEEQYYTDRSDNVIVEDGLLKITAKRENFQGSEYTSARLITYQKFDFTYGRVEARAKLPTGGGTWPAIWTLGSDFETNPWPAAGEMDLMEHVGNEQDIIFSSLHFPGNSGGNSITESIEVPGVSDEFHIYSMDWTAEEIRFAVDGEVYHVFENNGDLPFNKDFFLIVNVAMGGNFGGFIDPAFQESTMEIDYIRVYQ